MSQYLFARGINYYKYKLLKLQQPTLYYENVIRSKDAKVQFCTNSKTKILTNKVLGMPDVKVNTFKESKFNETANFTRNHIDTIYP